MRLKIVSLVLLVALIVIGPLLNGKSYDEIHLELANMPPSLDALFGTDELGRDLFARVLWGARLSLSIAFIAAIIDVAIGVLFGSVAALIGNRLGNTMMFLVDLLYALPYLVVVILFRLYLGAGLFPLILSLTCMGWITMCRIIYGHVRRFKELEFILASKAFGASNLFIFFHHLLPHLKEAIFSTLILTIPAAIFAEAFLSFMGLGVQPPLASLGTLCSEAIDSMRFYPWRLFFPSLIISWTVFTFYWIGEELKSESTA